MAQLDTLDRKILFELDLDSRAPYSAIGKAVRAKKETVKHRITRMVEKKVIGGFYAVIDYAKLGFLSFRLYLTLLDVTPEKREEILDYLLKNPKIWILYRTTGAYHFTFSIWVRDQWEYEKFWYDLVEKYGNYLSDHHLALVTKYTEFSRNYLVGGRGEKKEFTILRKTEKEKLDEIDFKILQIISRNARTSLTDMAEQTKVSVVTCRLHLRNLVKKRVIVGFRVMLNYEALGYQYYKVDMWLSNMQRYNEIMLHILSNKNVIYTERTLATSHFEFDLEVESYEKFIEIMDSFEEKFKGDIRKYTYYSLVKSYKISYLPSLSD